MKAKDKLDEGKSLPHNFIHRVINENTKFKVDQDVKIAHQTVYSRIWQKQPICDHCGPNIPLESIEKIILAISQQKAQMNQPLSPKKGLELANSLVSDTPVEEEIKKYYIYKKIFEEGGNLDSGNLLKRGFPPSYAHRDSHVGIQYIFTYIIRF